MEKFELILHSWEKVIAWGNDEYYLEIEMGTTEWPRVWRKEDGVMINGWIRDDIRQIRPII